MGQLAHSAELAWHAGQKGPSTSGKAPGQPAKGLKGPGWLLPQALTTGTGLYGLLCKAPG